MSGDAARVSSLQAKPGLVLHVEDNPGDRQLIRAAIAEAYVGLEIVHVSNGADALGFLAYAESARLPNLIIIDMNMPKVSGLQFLAAIKANQLWKSIPAVVLSSSESPKDREDALSLGAAAFLSKPAEWDRHLELARRLATFITASGA